MTGYVVAGLVFWVFCFGISRYSQMLERRLAQGGQRVPAKAQTLN
jgi:general L-amino acid transport system permease protein